MDRCFYCQKDANVEAFRNPYTKEIHPTCEQCRKDFTSFAEERLFFARAIFVVPLFILGTIILIFFNWRWGLFGLIICIILEIISIKLLSHYKKRRELPVGRTLTPTIFGGAELVRIIEKSRNMMIQETAYGQTNNYQIVPASPAKSLMRLLVYGKASLR